MMRILDCLPPLYEGLLPGLFRRRIPEESLADCTECPMCRRPGEPRAPGVSYFEPDARCCTFYPIVPNYLIGALLSDRSPAYREGRRRVKELLLESDGAGPLGLAPPRGYQRRYARLGERGFGRRRSLLCPYFRLEANDCSIWGFRNSVCTTYFCRPAGGIPGAGFWRAVQRYLGVLEKSLAAHALAVLGPSAVNGSPATARLYREAHAIVQGMSPRAVTRVGGEQARNALAELRDALRRMLDGGLPPHLRRNPALGVRPRRGQVYLQVPDHIAYRLERHVWEALECFDGIRESRAVVQEARREHGLELTREFLLALYRGGILLPGEAPAGPRS